MLVAGKITQIMRFDFYQAFFLRALKYALVEIRVKNMRENCNDVKSHF
jgi:hypothetical protein